MASMYAALVLLCGLTVHATGMTKIYMYISSLSDLKYVSSTAGSMPSEYVRCRNFMDGIDQMVEDDSVSSELEKGNREF